MSAAAITLMIVTLVLVWGGLAALVIALRVLPVPEDADRSDAESSTSREAAGS